MTRNIMNVSLQSHACNAHLQTQKHPHQMPPPLWCISPVEEVNNGISSPLRPTFGKTDTSPTLILELCIGTCKKVVNVSSQDLKKQLILHEILSWINCALQDQSSITNNFVTHAALKPKNWVCNSCLDRRSWNSWLLDKKRTMANYVRVLKLFEIAWLLFLRRLRCR